MVKTLSIEAVPGHADFRALGDIAGIRVDLRYAGPDNFVRDDMYSPHDCAWLHRDAAASLDKAVALLVSLRPGAALLVLDALRPQRVQERMWAALESTPLTQYLAHPARGSIHSFGMAVDITIVDAAGRELDMGTGLDDLTERSQPTLEEGFLERGDLAELHVENRKLLRAVMNEAGWRGINTEWWHFDGGDRDLIREKYLRVL